MGTSITFFETGAITDHPAIKILSFSSVPFSFSKDGDNENVRWENNSTGSDASRGGSSSYVDTFLSLVLSFGAILEN